MRHDRIVLGYHGCDAPVAGRLLGGEPFHKSENDYDWLGTGVYFWEYGADRALLIQLGHCFDLMDTGFTQELGDAYWLCRSYAAESGMTLPRNAGSTPDKKLRRLDCSVLNHYLALQQRRGNAFDTVRGGFVEGDRAFPGSGIFRESHIQIAVRNPACVLGVFRPRVTP